ncbi:MAG TPA: helix-turn-helix domain-containing protein [Ktedonobacteraceae bacterium]|nr:helix-turn-helix domain-containing protein [Ktedonobacteraceae bacterium]
MSKYSVKLTLEQRRQLEGVVKKGTTPAREILHAQVLLKTDSGEHGPRWSVKQIQAAYAVGSTTIKRIRHRFMEQGLDAAVTRKKQAPRPQKRKIDGEQEAHIIAMMCTQTPQGRERWTLRTVRDRAIELEIVEEVSYETIRTVLKKTNSSPGKRSNGV